MANKKILSCILPMAALFSEAPTSTRTNWFYFAHGTGAFFAN